MSSTSILPQTTQNFQAFSEKPRIPGAIDPAIDELIGGKVVAHRPAFARCFGGATVGLLLSQFWYYSRLDTAQARGGWFYATMQQIEHETGLTRTEQETARRKLRQAGILEEKKEGIPARLWFHVDRARAIEMLRAFLEKDAAGGSSPPDSDPDPEIGQRPTSLDAENLQTGMQVSCIQAAAKAADRLAGFPHVLKLDFSHYAV